MLTKMFHRKLMFFERLPPTCDIFPWTDDHAGRAEVGDTDPLEDKVSMIVRSDQLDIQEQPHERQGCDLPKHKQC